MKLYKDIVQGSDEWKRLRLGKITGTRVKNIMKPDNLSVVDELIAEMVSGEIEEDGFINEAMQRGKDYEPLARNEFQSKHRLNIEQFGFIQSSKYEWLGFSPDGLVKSESIGKYELAIEIKCPETKTHVRYIRQNSLPNEYKYQIYTAFIVCQDLTDLEFISYDTRFAIKPLHSITIKRINIEKEIAETEAALIKFWSKFEEYYKQVTF